jgi:hypothetical protein
MEIVPEMMMGQVRSVIITIIIIIRRTSMVEYLSPPPPLLREEDCLLCRSHPLSIYVCKRCCYRDLCALNAKVRRSSSHTSHWCLPPLFCLFVHGNVTTIPPTHDVGIAGSRRGKLVSCLPCDFLSVSSSSSSSSSLFFFFFSFSMFSNTHTLTAAFALCIRFLQVYNKVADINSIK